MLALFAKSHGCRDLVALDAATGQRRWYRTVEITTPGPADQLDRHRGGDRRRSDDRVRHRRRAEPVDLLRRRLHARPGRRRSDWVATVSRCAGGLRRLVVHSSTVDKAPWVGR